MKATSFKVSFGQTVNTGNFESVRIDAEVEYELEPGETIEDAFEKGFKEVFKQVNPKAKLIKASVEKKQKS